MCCGKPARLIVLSYIAPQAIPREYESKYIEAAESSAVALLNIAQMAANRDQLMNAVRSMAAYRDLLMNAVMSTAY